ncbi:lactosylceramide 4-alpha-galactosyltransferase [Striga asiatica]|uniref:Lactosylceramide 4-alpha-galactosyltransferase n=1 Tax=Striga asiatica TaxID=4170 RepID=A0A5A7R9R1_STRAF|nr:lactosylceramide 4-alpha-galactosyltransferase [Striga asiatica]
MMVMSVWKSKGGGPHVDVANNSVRVLIHDMVSREYLHFACVFSFCSCCSITIVEHGTAAATSLVDSVSLPVGFACPSPGFSDFGTAFLWTAVSNSLPASTH